MVFGASFAQEKTMSVGVNNGFSLQAQSPTKYYATNSFASLKAAEKATNQGTFVSLSVEGYNTTNVVGAPALPVLHKLIEIPQGAGVQVTINGFESSTITLAELGLGDKVMPFQPSVSKSEDPANAVFQYSAEAYAANAFSKNDLVSVEILGTMRGVRIARLTVAPFSYNPVTGVIEIANDINFEISFTNADLGATEQIKTNYFSPYFAASLYPNVANYKASAKGLPEVAPVTYVIVSDPMFETALQEFIEWKTKKGFKVVEAYTNNPAVGNTTASIKAYLQNLYENPTAEVPAPTFVLIVGDVAQVPTFTGVSDSHVTDLYFCEYTNDIFPEVFYGRFSATNLAQLQPQIDKTLEYEQYLMPDPSFLEEVVMVSGVDGTYAAINGNGQINYGTSNYFNAAHNITSHTYLYPASGSSASQIIQNVSDGAAFANYTAHCSPDGWADPNFGISDIATLTNANKYPLMVGNCCSSVEFQITCFGEEILRAANKGAVGYIGGSNSTYWDEDYWWGVGNGTVTVNPTYAGTGLGAYDRTFHDHAEEIADWYITQGQMVSGGNLAVSESGSDREVYYWEIYHLMGDPSLMVYMGVPQEMVATYADVIIVGATQFPVNTEPYAYVALSRDAELIGAAMADENGLANVPFSPTVEPGVIDIVITAQNRQPHIETVTVIVPAGPYVLLDNYSFNDEGGNNNGAVDYAETLTINAALKNVGVEITNGVTAVLSTEDEFVTINEDTYEFGNIAAGTIVTIENAFEFETADNTPDMHRAVFTVSIEDNAGNTWSGTINADICAPELDGSLSGADVNAIPVFTSMPITTANAQSAYTYNVVVIEGDSDGNGSLDAGETCDVVIEAANIGHAASLEGTASISTTSEYITINVSEVFIDALEADSKESQELIFSISVAENTPIGEPVNFHFTINCGEYSYEFDASLKVGLIQESFETGDFSAYNWNLEGDADWSVDDAVAYDGVFSALTGDIDDSGSASLSMTVNVLMDDVISFYYKVSSEGTYDYLTFYIDSQMKGEWSGDIATWTMAEYPVTAGNHTFKWEYSKDGSVSSGSDCAWVDLITFPAFAAKDGDEITSLDITASTLPSWLTLTDNGDGTATITGTPANTVIGNHNVVLVAENAIGNTNEQAFTIQVGNVLGIDNLDNAMFNIYPNPANESATIAFQTVENAVVTISITNLLGQEVAVVLPAKNLAAGTHNVEFNASELNAGVYFCKIMEGNKVTVRQFVITK